MSRQTEANGRLFFALTLPGPLRQRLASWRSGLALSGRMVAPDDLHLTLVFLGTQPGSNLALLTDIATNLRGRPFTLCLDQLRCRRGGLVLLAPRQVPDELLALQQGLLQALSEAGVAADTRPYHPHLTLARHSRLPANSEARAFTWRVTRFALLGSRQQATGQDYQVLGEWLLRP